MVADVGQQARGVRLRVGGEEAHDLLAADSLSGRTGVLEAVGVEADRHAGVEPDAVLGPAVAEAEAEWAGRLLGVRIVGGTSTIGGAWPAFA